MNESENIELRSEKVRTIIGQIPPIIIRIGITVIFFIIIGMLTGSYFFKYDYTIKTLATIEQPKDTTIIVIKIPANVISKVKIGHKVILNFNKVPNLYNERIISEIQTIPNQLVISKLGGFYLTVITLTKEESKNSPRIVGTIEIDAEIVTDKISIIDRIIEPFKSLLKHTSEK